MANSTLVMNCTLEDPLDKCDVNIVSPTEFEVDGISYTLEGAKVFEKEARDNKRKKKFLKKLWDIMADHFCDKDGEHLILEVMPSVRYGLSDTIQVLLGSKILGYLNESDTYRFMPIYHHYSNSNTRMGNFVQVTILRLDSSKYGSDGIIIRIGLK